MYNIVAASASNDFLNFHKDVTWALRGFTHYKGADWIVLAAELTIRRDLLMS